MKGKTKFLGTFYTAIIGLLISTIGLSFAWFVSKSSIETNDSESGIQGAVLTSYFHGTEGKGTSDKPFIITRPKHWENLIWLHNNLEGFYNSDGGGRDHGGYYFQIGTALDDSGTPKVYSYDDNGSLIYNGDQPALSTTLNLTSYNSDKKGLVPLGSPQTPWLSSLEGNNITLSGFKVLSVDTYNDDHALEDIGIFGYVSEYGYCSNVYFDNFVIDTSGAALNESDAYSGHTSHSNKSLGGGTNYPCVGYIAGHILKAASFSNVYVNNCKIDGSGSTSNGQLDSYGYYGLVELVEQGSQFGTGNNYDFTFDSSAVYDYLEDNYDNISGNPIRARNTEYEQNVIHEAEYQKNSSGTYVAQTPFSDGIKQNSSGNYNLIGDDPDDYAANEYKGYNYSLSTLGYAEVDEASKDLDYTVKAKASNGTLSNVSKDVTWYPDTYYSLSSAKSDITKFDSNGHYSANNATWNSSSSRWEYYHVDSTDRGKVPVKLHFTCKGSVVVNKKSTTNAPTLESASSFAQVFVDGQLSKTYTIANGDFKTFKGSYQGTSSFLGRTWYDNAVVTVDFEQTVNLNLSMGTHYVACIVVYDFNDSITQYSYGCLGYYSSISSKKITQNTFVINQSTADNHQFDITVPVSNGTSESGTDPTTSSYSCNGGTFDESKRTLIDSGSDSEAKTLVGIDASGTEHIIDNKDWTFNYVEDKKIYVEGTGDYVLDDDDQIIFLEIPNDDGTTTRVPKRTDGHWQVVTPAHWNAHLNLTRQIKVDDKGKPIVKYIGDLDALTGSGYNAENIDVVGGGFTFSDTFVTIDGEEDRATTSPITSNDIGKPFYATKYAASCVVLYLSNVGGTNTNDKMGSIKFYYGWTVSNFFGYEFKSMCFKQGGTSYVYFEDVKLEDSDYSSGQGDSSLDRIVTIQLKRGSVEKAAYCALDEDGNILTGYDANGNQVGKDAKVPTKDIDRYVLLMGVKNNLDWISINTRVQKIEFSYVAPKGFGGDFGTVEYRSSGTVTGTIFNFYYLCPDGDKYRVKVSFANNKYTVTFFYYSASSKEETINVNFYLYDTTTYTVDLVYMNSATSTSPTTTSICSTGSSSIKIYSTAVSTWTI